MRAPESMWLLRKARPFLLSFFLSQIFFSSSPRADAEDIAFDRPESWALKYYTAVTTFTGLAAPRVRPAGTVEIGLEGGWIPYVSESDRRVGFDGTALEDLNKTPVFARPSHPLTCRPLAAGSATITKDWRGPVKPAPRRTRPKADATAFRYGNVRFLPVIPGRGRSPRTRNPEAD